MNSKSKKTVSIIIFLLGLLLVNVFINLSNSEIFNYSFQDKVREKDKFNLDINVPLTPSGIRITAINDSSNSIVITWYTTQDASDPKVIYSVEPTLINNITVVPTTINIDTSYIYSANLKDLKPNTTYYYKISSDSSNEREILDFKTTAERNATHLKFLLYGDSRSQPEQRNELTQKIMQYFDDTEFLVHTGDIINDGTDQTLWNSYFNDVELITKKVPGFYIEGNHEAQSQKMYDNIPLPSNGLNSRYYNFSIGPISFIGLNTERDIAEQTTWLEKTLKFINQDNESLWKIVYMHQPFFNSRSTRPDRTDLITTWGPLFEEYYVDFVFAGHNHYYERSYPINLLKQYDDTSSFYLENPQNPTYFITGGAGAPLYERDTNPDYAPFYNSTYHFIIAEVKVDDLKEETVLKFETWAMPTDYSGIYLIDNLTVVKKGAFLNIHNPIADQLYAKNAPQFNITIDKVKLKPTWFTLNTTWYSIDNGKTNYTFIGETGIINQSGWDSVLDETVNINFYANDSLGNIIYNMVTIRKDFIAPNISIINPTSNQLFGLFAVNFSLNIDEPFLNLTWYTMDGGITNHSFTGTTGTINQTVWESFDDGFITIIFYANDSLGNLGSSEIIIRKDTKAPNIIVFYPQSNETFGINAPNYSVFITDEHLDSMWYSFNGSEVKIIFNENSTIDQDEWEKLPNGMFKLIFFANDSAGNFNYVEITLHKDIPDGNDNTDIKVLIGTVVSFVIFLTIGLISYIYLLRKKINKQET
ncbi:MAG: purple acid phosphatase family protein [Candidatus Odinarchaeota archaeon]